jgi:hypothetical protein
VHYQAQRVIPCRIQKKYFNMIRRKLLERVTFIKSHENKTNNSNMTTKTFFNFSYKRYRFYFGIYIPCQHSIASKNLPIPPSSCELASPIVILNNRHGCASRNIKKEQLL